MRQALYAVFAMLALNLGPAICFAEGVPEVVLLTPENVSELRFSVNVDKSYGGTNVTLVGPTIGPNGCGLSRSGNALVDVDGKQVAAFASHWSTDTKDPRVFSTVADGWRFPKLAVFLDYLDCPAEKTLSGVRYVIEDVSAFLEGSKPQK